MSFTTQKVPEKAPEKIGILGTGALGGFYGGLLAKAGLDVHFLLNRDYEHVREHGLKVESKFGDFKLNSVQAHASAADMPQVDLAIVCWKSTVPQGVLTEVLDQICHENTQVLVLQNGLDVEVEAASKVGAEQVLGGCAFLCSNKVGPGHIRHLDYGAIAFGEFSDALRGEVSERMTRWVNLFTQAGIDLRPAKDLQLVRWKKLVWNIPFNGLSVILNADTNQIMQDPESASLARDLMIEVQQAAEAQGLSISDAHIEKMLDDTRSMVPYDSSMRLDFKARRPIEVEAIFGNPLRAALVKGFRPTKIEMLYQQLCFADRANREP